MILPFAVVACFALGRALFILSMFLVATISTLVIPVIFATTTIA